MRIKKLEMKNFRGFEELTVQFPEKGSAVFVGVNGAGKSSMLEAILLLLFVQIESRGTRDKKIEFEEGDLRRGALYIENELELSFEGIDYKSKMTRGSDNDNLKGISFNHYKNNLRKTLIEKTAFNSKVDSPFFTYYPTSRLVEDEPSLKIKDISRLNQLDAILQYLPRLIDFNDFFEWFRNTEDLENEIRLQEDNNHRNRGLEVIRKAIKIFLPNVSNFRIKRKGVLEFIIEKEGDNLVLGNLSHGEKAMFAMIGDIARRLSIANPSLENPLKGEGIILIDEIELHLHPKWQRTIVPRLEKTFPNIQFILTTHSPQVLSSMKRENVFVLENFKLKKSPNTFWRDSNSILENVFKTEERQLDGVEAIKKLYDLIHKEKKEEASKMLEELEDELGDDYRELIRAKTYIDLMED